MIDFPLISLERDCFDRFLLLYYYIWSSFVSFIVMIKGMINGVLDSIGMIMGAAASTVYYNLKLRHPTIDMPIIDYDLAVLIQPMLMLGISIGVAFNVVFADWMVTVLLIVLFIGNTCHIAIYLFGLCFLLYLSISNDGYRYIY